MTRKDSFYLVTLFILSGMLYFFNLGGYGLIDPDEPFYAGAAKEMLLRHDFSTPFLFGHPLFEKPVFIYWVIGFCFKVFGISEFSARLGPAIFGILTVLAIYLLARILFRKPQIAFLSALIFAFSLESIILARTVLTDMVLTFFFTVSYLCFFAGYRFTKHRNTAWLGMFLAISLGFLTKGPLAILVPFVGIATFLLLNRGTILLSEIPWKKGIVLFLAFGFSWYALMIFRYGSAFTEQMFIHENLRRFFVSEHHEIDRFFYYPLNILVGFFPWSFFVLGALIYCIRALNRLKNSQKTAYLFIVSSLSIILIFFTMARSKLPSYIFPAFPLISILTGAWLYKLKRIFGLRKKGSLAQDAMVFVFGVAAPLALVSFLYYFDNKRGYGLGKEWILFGVVWVAAYVVSFIFWRKRKLKEALSFLLAAIFMSVFFCFGRVLPKLDPYISSIQFAEDYSKYQSSFPDSFNLASKICVRGIYYYANIPYDKIGVFASHAGTAFYTKHPIPLWSTREELLILPLKNYPVFCFFKKKEYKALAERIGQGFKLTEIHSNSERVFAKLERTG